MIGVDDSEHSAYNARYFGACLPVRGLLEIGAETIRSKIVFEEPTKEFAGLRVF